MVATLSTQWVKWWCSHNIWTVVKIYMCSDWDMPLYTSCHDIKISGVYIRWNGIVEWNSGMDYWNGGMLHRTYLIIQHVLYSEQWALCCVLCMHCWLDGWLARLVLHCMNFELWPRPLAQDTPSDCTHTVCEKGKMTIVINVRYTVVLGCLACTRE